MELQIRYFLLTVSVFIFFTLVANVAFAAEAAVVAQDPWWHLALVDAFIGLGGIILAFIGKNLGKLFDYLAERSKLSFLARVDDLVMDVVLDIYAAEVEAAKAARADGKLTDAEKKRFKEIAIERLKALLGLDGLAKLTGLFSDSGTEVGMVLGQKVEKAITVAKNAGAARKPDPSKASSDS